LIANPMTKDTSRHLLGRIAHMATLAAIGFLCASGFAFAQTAQPPVTGSAPAAHKELIAVLDIDPVGGASKAEALAMSERLREELLRTGKFTMIDRSELNKVMDEQALQQTGLTNQERAVQVGKVLGAHRLISGRAIKVADDLWLVSGTMVDVETAEIISAESIRYKGDMFSLLDTAIASLATRLSIDSRGQQQAGAAPAGAPTGPRSLVILPTYFTGGAAGFMGNHKKELEDHISAAVTEKGFVTKGRADPAGNEVLQASVWSGFFLKSPDLAVVWQQAKAAGADTALAVYSSWDGGTAKTFTAYLYDARSLKEFKASGTWPPKSGPSETLPFWLNAVQGGVRDVLAQYEAAMKR
jgi:hypothetical protein